MDKTEKMLKELTEASGVSGYEKEIRDVIRGYLKTAGQLSQDKLGSLICKKKGTSEGPKVVVAGHMDEVGFMVKYITDDGFIRFTPLGGWWDQVLLAQRVVIKTTKGNVTGIIGAKPPHVMNAEERKKLVEKKEMYIDIGASSRDEVDKAGVRVGDPIVPASDFEILAGGKTYLAKAFDDRIGCAMIISVLEQLNDGKHPNTIYGIATAQEEVGSRGAKTSIDAINPDVAIILEVEISGDVPGIKPEEAPVKMGKGPSILAYDAGMIPNLKLRDLIIDTAKANKINLQVAAMEGGGTDGDMIHLHRSGVPTIVLSVPTRHIHSHASIIHRQDFDDTVKLAVALVRKLNAKVVAGLTE